MKRIITLVSVLGLALAFPIGATAKGKPGPPPEPPPTVEVVMTGNIATTTDCGGPLAMVLDGESLTMEWTDTAVEMSFGPLSGCHGPLVQGLESDYSGQLSFTQMRDGRVRLLSQFDYSWGFVTVGKKQVWRVVSLYSIDGSLEGSFDWSSGGTLSGSVLLKTFHSEGNTGSWTELGTFPVTVTVQWPPPAGS